MKQKRKQRLKMKKTWDSDKWEERKGTIKEDRFIENNKRKVKCYSERREEKKMGEWGWGGDTEGKVLPKEFGN